ncbi:FAD-dependent monooxygenase [Paenibacillus sp. JTLBN-2024]
MAGSSLAIRLGSLGWNTMLFDRLRFPRHKACGEFLSPETLEVFKELGVYEALKALKPGRITKARIVFRHGGVVEAKLEQPAWGLSRYEMDAVLLEASEKAGTQVYTGTSVSSIAADSGAFRIGIRSAGGTNILYARTVFAAWGVHPRTELAARPAKRRGRTAYIGIKAHFGGVATDQAVELYFIRHGHIGISPVEGGKRTSRLSCRWTGSGVKATPCGSSCYRLQPITSSSRSGWPVDGDPGFGGIDCPCLFVLWSRTFEGESCPRLAMPAR